MSNSNNGLKLHYQILHLYLYNIVGHGAPDLNAANFIDSLQNFIDQLSVRFVDFF